MMVEVEQGKWNDFQFAEKLTRQLKAIFQQSRISRINFYLHASFYVQYSGRPTQDVRSQKRRGRSLAEQVERFLKRRKVDLTSQDYSPTGAHLENKLFAHANFHVQCLGRPTQVV